MYLGWESNPHTVVHEFESCASTNSATKALLQSAKVQKNTHTTKNYIINNKLNIFYKFAPNLHNTLNY